MEKVGDRGLARQTNGSFYHHLLRSNYGKPVPLNHWAELTTDYLFALVEITIREKMASATCGVSHVNSTFREEIFPNLKQLFPSAIIDEEESDEKEISLRLSINESEAETFPKHFSRLTNTEWIVYFKARKPEK